MKIIVKKVYFRQNDPDNHRLNNWRTYFVEHHTECGSYLLMRLYACG